MPVRLACWCCRLLFATLLDCTPCASAFDVLRVFASVVVGVVGPNVSLNLAYSYGVLVALGTLELLGLMCLCTWPILWCYGREPHH